MVTKLTTLENAKDEIREQMNIDRFDPDFVFHLKPPTYCNYEPKRNDVPCDLDVKPREELNTLMILPDAGNNLQPFQHTGLYLLSYSNNLDSAILQIIFIGLASLTFPHILLEYFLEKNEK